MSIIWSRTLSGRLIRNNPLFLQNMAEEPIQENEDEIQSQHDHDRRRTLRDHMNPTRTSAPSCLVFPPDASHFNFKPGIIQFLPNFHGLDSENPYMHLREFEEVCNTYNDLNCSMNTIRLKLFPFSLKDKAKTWLQNLRSGSIRTWDELQQQFLKKFFPSHRTNSFKRQIITFTQKQGETFYQCWDRYKELLNLCPHHGFEIWRVVSQFYEGLTPKDRQMVEFMCNGTFEDKDPNEAIEYLDSLAENAQNWDTIGTIEPSNKIQSPTSGGGMYTLKDEHDLQARFTSLARKVEALELKKNGQLKSVQEIACHICDTSDHSTKDCPTLPSFKECLHEQANVLNNLKRPNFEPFSQSYNPGWRNHPNFSWRNDNAAQFSQPHFQNQQNFQNYAPYVPPPKRNLEDILNSFIAKQESINTQTAQTMTDLKDTLAKFASALNVHEKGKFPSQPLPNPKDHHSQTGTSGTQPMDQVKSVITLRSGKVVEKSILEPCEDDDKSTPKGKEVEPITCEEEVQQTVSPPFPHALKNTKKSNLNSDIYDIFKQVKVNIPLLDAIKQVPSYAKFLKDLCTVKRKLNVKKKAFLAEQVSAIIQNNNALKYKDPGCPTISCIIGERKIKKALLDLGASVNLLPYSVYQELNLGELKPTSVTLLLADRSVKVPRGMVEDVLVQVDNFVYPVDFIVLDTQPIEACNAIPVILGRPFLATSNALINCRNGIMKLSFGNMTLELNVFNLCKQPHDKGDESEDENLIETLVEENIQEGSTRDQLDICSIETVKENIEIDLDDFIRYHSLPGSEKEFDAKYENKDEPPILELKPLPEELKYAFLGEDETYPVVISSKLASDEEGKANVVANTLNLKSVSSLSSLIQKPLLLDLQRSEIAMVEQRTIARLSALVIRPTLTDRIRREQPNNNQLMEFLSKVDKKGNTEFAMNTDDLLTLKGRICVPSGNDLRGDVLTEAHTTPYSIHPGRTKMYQDQRRLYWEHITMDFATGLPRAPKGCNSIWVIVDRLTKSAHFLPVKTTFTMNQYDEAYVAEIVRLHGSWDSKLPHFEFTYKNSYQETIGMAPYEALYGRKCRSPLNWDEVGERKMLGPKLVQQTTDVIALIQEIMKTAQSRQKSYADIRSRPLEFEVGNHVFVKIAPCKGIMRFGRKGKLSPRFIDQFEILDRIGERAYRLALQLDLDRIHNVFNVSMLKKYISNPSHVLRHEPLDLMPNLTYQEVPIQILDRKVKVLRNKESGIIKILWRNWLAKEATWEPEEEMKQ
ncbi:uncharacterized protein [Primulina huaijiensis]|uniref:uncharacterized protein n=1 Tax=Primulina huaijiensis TaxID=1492673 RepID=UPI003CC6E480